MFYSKCFALLSRKRKQDPLKQKPRTGVPFAQIKGLLRCKLQIKDNDDQIFKDLRSHARGGHLTICPLIREENKYVPAFFTVVLSAEVTSVPL